MTLPGAAHPAASHPPIELPSVLSASLAGLLAFNLNFIPLLVAVALTLPVVLSPSHRGINRWTKRLALTLFGSYVHRLGRNRARREAILNAAHIPTTFRVYSAKTLMYSTFLAVAGSIYGVYILWGLLVTQRVVSEDAVRKFLEANAESFVFLANLFAVPALSLEQLFVLFLIFSSTVGVLLGVTTYLIRWWWPSHLAANRRRRIEASLPRIISFIYALSRSGMNFPRVMRILAENRAVYGDAAEEVGVAVREMDLIGKDLVSAIQSMSERTPSEQFREFTANLGSVLQSGRSLSLFLREQYERYREEAKAQQEQLLTMLATMAEVYVTALVAGPLFLITILVVMGLSFGGTIDILRLTAYGIIPLANIAFILYLSTVTESLRATRDRIEIDDPLGGIANVRRIAERDENVVRPDGGGEFVHPNIERLDRYNTFRGLRKRINRPVETLMLDPTAILWVTIPIAVLFVAIRVPAAISFSTLAVDIRVLDDIIIRAILFVSTTFAVVHYAYTRRVRRIEAVIPDFLDRLASINEAGMTIVESMGRLRRSDLGALDLEIERIWADIEWGADVESALYRFERRVQTTVVTRVVTLLNNAMSTSGDLSDVLRIAAEQAKSDRRLARERRQEMVTYMMVIYVSFFVFLVIVGALNVVLIPSLPTDGGIASGAGETASNSAGALASLGNVPPEEYELLFFHTAILQGLFSGFVAGQMGGGNPKHGAKHASFLLLIAYIVFLTMP